MRAKHIGCHLPLGQDVLETLLDVLVVFVPYLKNQFGLHSSNDRTHRFIDEVEADFVEEDGEQSEEHSDDDVGHQKSVPEPDCEVDLFVDYVLWDKEASVNFLLYQISNKV